MSQIAGFHSSSSVSAVPLSPATVGTMQYFWTQVDAPSSSSKKGQVAPAVLAWFPDLANVVGSLQ